MRAAKRLWKPVLKRVLTGTWRPLVMRVAEPDFEDPWKSMGLYLHVPFC